jgi:hypothetical protein
LSAAEAASPTISEIFARFLDAQRERLASRTFANYREVIELFADCLNGYGHQFLDTDERAAFSEAFERDDDAFCNLFGADKIEDCLGEFLDYFMIRKVAASRELLRAAGTVTNKLIKWMASNDLVGDDDVTSALDRSSEAARHLPDMSQLSDLLLDQVLAGGDIDPGAIDDADWHEGPLQISRIEPGRFWFDGTYGPVRVPGEASDIAEVGWTVTATLARVAGRWHLTEVGNVYPY